MPQELHLVRNDNSLEGAAVRDRTFQACSSTIGRGPPNISGTDAFALPRKQVRRYGVAINGIMNFRLVTPRATVLK
jgi:hypothetical protein